MRRSRRLTALLGVLTLALPLAACGGSDSDGGGKGLEKTTLTVASLPLVDGAALHIAQKQKLFEKEGLKVQIKPVAQSTLAMPALIKGDVDLIAGANYVTFLQAQDKGTLKLSVLAEGATLTSNMMNVLVLPKSDIKTAKDLEGKKVAVNILNNIQGLTLNAILKANNVDPTKVNYTAIPFPQMATALEKGQVDAIHVVEPFLSDTQKKLGARVVVDGGSQPVTGVPISGYVATQKFTGDNPKTSAAFQRAILKAQALAAGDRKRVEEVLPTYARIDKQVASVITLPGYPTSLNATRMQRVVDLMNSAGLLKEKTDIKPVLFQPTS
ncbi:ABC transporter substrate-binding protein [Spirillospora albida]|uniref:ABC transporter substrate-binding protein n=1 Tax=Spirillospora albida TaxID=58123 RepID=UPI0004C0A72F|nr:ABC transporter substrate-binding protein [Spirillospora albida]